jgi:prephenate dehydratase
MSTVAIQGVVGSYSEEATRRLLESDAEIVECLNFRATFDAVLRDVADYAVVPVENKIVGEIAGSMSILRKEEFRIFERLLLRVKHVLCGTPDSLLANVRSVRSHTEALKQCKKFLSVNGLMRPVIGADTASSVRRIIEENDSKNAAIGSRRASELYGAKILAENIADDEDNWTTFYLIGK